MANGLAGPAMTHTVHMLSIQTPTEYLACLIFISRNLTTDLRNIQYVWRPPTLTLSSDLLFNWIPANPHPHGLTLSKMWICTLWTCAGPLKDHTQDRIPIKNGQWYFGICPSLGGYLCLHQVLLPIDSNPKMLPLSDAIDQNCLTYFKTWLALVFCCCMYPSASLPVSNSISR